MAEPHRYAEEANEALDPELLYTKEYCIGQSAGFGLGRRCLDDGP